jgi:hypothetical protein
MKTLVTQVSLLSMTLVIMAPTEQAPSLHPFLISRISPMFPARKIHSILTFTIYDGIRSDLFEDLFQTLTTGVHYRAPGQNSTGCFGPLLLSKLDQLNASDQSTVFAALVAHADDGLFLSALYHHLTLE